MQNILQKKLAFLFIFALFGMTQAYSKSTPPLSIVAQESVQNMLPNTTQSITYTIKNNVPIAPVMLNMSTSRTKLTPSSSFTTWQITDDCVYKGMNHYIAPNGLCHVIVTIDAGSTAAHIEQNLIINYGPTFQTIAPAPVLSFDISPSATGFFFTIQPAGNNMLVNTTQHLSWTVQNTTASNIAINNATINFTVASPLIAAPTFANDCGSTVTAGGGICNITTTIQALGSAGEVNQYLAIPYDAGKTLIVDQPTNFSIRSNANTRTFSFENLCPYDVWIAFVGGGQINGCATDTDCDNKPNVIPGTFACDPTADAGAGICNWKNPTPAGGDYRVLANGGTKDVTLIENVYALSSTQHLVWSGVIGGRTSCTSSGCSTADCGGGQGGCPVGQGLSQPAQQAEPTFQQESDFYDITGINGINIPMSIEPQGVTRDAFNPYTCGAPGITTDQASTGGTIGGCTWNFVPPSNSYIWVANGGAPCTANNECNEAGGEACGLSVTNIALNSAQNTCGIFEGYWTADQVCGINSSYSQAPYFCNNPATNGTFTNMYQCSGTGYDQSCYNSSNSTTCCGCQNWQEAPTNIVLPSNPAIVPQCNVTGNNSNNAVWSANALPTLGWYKAACPPFYVYPFDDKSSTFSCTNNPGGVNSTNYKITYCPGGRSGAPVGVTPNP
ncbi:MAG: thaumatin family protein [Legionella sp.]|nr:thaumatin family protein [Legionella sp.]